MAISLPLPFRVAAGILGTGIDLVRSLPEELPALPVTLVGNAMKLSIKVQQEIATLATRGDELLVGVTGGPEENPAWAKFDDDEPAQPVRPVRPVRGLKTPAGEPGKPGPKTHADEPTPTEETSRADVDLHGEGVDDPPALTTPEASSIPPTSTTAMDAAIDVAEAVIEEALIAVPDPAVPESGTAPQLADSEVEAEIEAEVIAEVLEDAVALELAAELTEAVEDAVALELAAEVTEALEDAVALELALEVTEALEDANSPEQATGDAEIVTDSPVIFEETAELTEALPIPLEIVEEVLEAADEADIEEARGEGPEALPDYDQMTLTQVRGHLRDLSFDEVSALLTYEQDGDARPPFLTLLSNRLVTLDASNQ